VDRREFLRLSALVTAAAAYGPTLLRSGNSGTSQLAAKSTPLLAGPARECPIDTVVVLMMENRSFDHFLGWLGTDQAYLEAGRSRWGEHFTVAARQHLRYRDPTGRWIATEQLTRPEDPDPSRVCTGPMPGHDWNAGRVQRDHGFLAAGSHNEESAIGYYTAGDVPVHAALARRFTVNDHHFASLLGPTFPNRMYFHSAQSEGRKQDPGPLRPGIFDDLTIWDRLSSAGVSAGYYYADSPASILVYGARMHPYIRVFDRYFEDCAKGTLPNFTFVAPAFSGTLRTDDHPRGCINIGERFILETVGAFVQSPQWDRGMFVLCFDEWGGFFDHVRPPHFADDLTSTVDANDFSQAGFRVPSIIASPYARPGAVDHTFYDHTSIMRFLEWRFLGAPAQGPGTGAASWALTKRDRHANNIGRSLRTQRDAEVDLQISVGRPTPACGNEPSLALQDPEADAFRVSEEMQALTDRLYPAPTLTPWLD
jgi:phospholipase C